MKKALAWLLVLSMTAALAVGGTLAYLTDTDEDVNVMTVGKVRIDQLEYERESVEAENGDATVQEFHDNKPLYPAVTEDGFDYTPGDSYVDWDQIGKYDYTSEIWDPTKINNEQDKMVFVKNKGDFDAYVRTVFGFEANGYTLAQFKELFHLNLNETDWTWEWTEATDINGTNYILATATYNKILAPGAITEISLAQIALDPKATNEDIKGFGDTYQILVQSQAVQADGFEDPATALNEAFGAIVVSDEKVEIPFTDDNPNQGSDLNTALQYYNGKKVNAEITKVVFGRRADYPEIVEDYDGVLVDVEQDIPAYAYHVKDSSGHTVYLLSNDAIYAPKSCKNLFSGMKAVKEIDLSNLDTSRVESMYGMFLNCQKLQTLDVSGWDTSRVTDTAGMFANCYELRDLDVSNWDMSSNTTTYYMFQRCYKLDTLDCSNWGMENNNSLEGMFAYCEGLTSLDLSGWDLSNTTTMVDTFKYCSKLKTVDTTGWSAPNVGSTRRMFFHDYALEEVIGITDWNLVGNTDLYYMFEECRALDELDLSGWNLTKAQEMKGIFFNCTGLEYVDVSGWDTSNATDMYAMFHQCISVKEINGLEDWDVSKVKDMSQMFRGCAQLEHLDVAGWRPSSCVTFSSMFSSLYSNAGDMKLKDLDVSQWDMSSAENVNWMFYGCGHLTELDLSGWDTSNITTMHHTFADCFKIEKYNFTGWDTSSVTTIDGIFNSNLALKSVDVSDFDTQNIVDFDQVFDGCTALEEIIGLDQWNTAKGEAFNEFLLNTKVRVLDLSSFDMSSAIYVQNMLYANYQLTTIYGGDNWNLNLEQLQPTGGMITACPNVVGGNGTKYSSSDASYMRLDGGEEAPGYLTYKAN